MGPCLEPGPPSHGKRLTFDSCVIDSVGPAVRRRWMGLGRTIQLRASVHIQLIASSTRNAHVLRTVLHITAKHTQKYTLCLCFKKTWCRTFCNNFIGYSPIFTALQYAGGLSYGKGVRLSVRLSVTRVNCDKRTKVPPRFLYHMKGKFMYFFGHVEWLVGDAPFYLKFWVELTHPASKTAIFTRYLLAAAQPLELAKKVQL